MRKLTEHAKQLKRMYSVQDGRFQGEAAWAKFPFFWFILFLSYTCTRRCNYCYALNQIDSDHDKMEMDENTFSRLLDCIPEVWNVNAVKVNAISFLGGEPLLRTDRIKQIMDHVFEHTDGMQGALFTNGDLIDSANWDDLIDIQWMTINITDISINELSRRMTIIKNRSNVIGQTIAATLDDDKLDRVIDITRFGIENGYRLRYYRNLYRGRDSEYKKRLLIKYHEICDCLEKYIYKGYEVHTTFLFDTLIPLWNYESSPYICGKHIATVYPDGTIGPCLRNHASKTGSIFDENPLSKIQCDTFHFDVEKPDLPDECRQCESKTACQGGCPHDKLLLTGTRSGKSVVCDIHKEIIPRLRYLDKLKSLEYREKG